MQNNIMPIEQTIKDKIYTIRDMQVMLDRDLAELYGVETKVFNQAVKRNMERFPKDFMFQLTKEELENWRSQFVTSNKDKMGLRRSPYAFTEQGVSMLSAILKSSTAVDISVKIIRTFVTMRRFISQNASIFQRIDTVETKQLQFKLETDEKFNKIFDAIESKEIKPKQGIFYDGQIYDAYVFVNDLLKSAKKEIVVIDNYIDDTVLTLFSKYSKIDFTIITKSISKQLNLDIKRYNQQYNNLTIKTSTRFHDRFLLIDVKEAYHIGASLKDLGKKVFGFSKINIKLIKETIKS